MKYRIYISIILLLLSHCLLAQNDTMRISEAIAVIGKPAIDSITLRWAPLKYQYWQEGNLKGYKIIRYTVVREGKLLSQPESIVLTSSPLLPLPESQWEPLVPKDKYAAIAAQALFGERFEIDMTQSDVISIVNKVKENEQRYAFALFAADMSPATAKASGLWFTDKTIKKGEKYLYRIIINNTADSLRGSTYIGSDDEYAMMKPQNLQAKFKDQIISLQWEKNQSNTYTAYVLELSADGKIFKPVSDEPLTTVSPTPQEESRYEYAVDSLPDLSNTWHYRVRGLTPFGELGEPSDIVSGKGNVAINEVPYISSGENINNQSIKLNWQFPDEYNKALKGFNVERSSAPNGTFQTINSELLPPQTRDYEDKKPGIVNYYRVTALSENGEAYKSPLYLGQLVDSIPPAKPTGLQAIIDENGNLELSWQPNAEEDMFGYRIYKSHFKSEELTQITIEPIKDKAFRDKINLNTLNKSVFYSVMALDRNQNQSPLSDLLEVSLPDKVKPQPPVFLPVTRTDAGTMLTWQPSSSDDVVRYDVYRQSKPKEWQRVKMIAVSSDTIYYFTDSYAEEGVTSNYTLIAIDKAGLESDRAVPVAGGKLDNKLKPAVAWKEPVIDKEKNRVVLKWNYTLAGVAKYQIYKANDKGAFTLYKTVPGETRELSELLIPGKSSQFKILAVFANNNKSELSKEVEITF